MLFAAQLFSDPAAIDQRPHADVAPLMYSFAEIAQLVHGESERLH